MTIKTFTATLLLAASFLLLTACNSKSGSETNTTAEQNPTTETGTGGTDDGTSSDGGGDDNTTATPTITLTSLDLTIEKTSLNKDENTTLKVMASYSDNSTKEVTDTIEWVIIPSDAVKITNTTLTALQDKATTVKAKLNNTLSNEINLDITWTVNGHTLPPEPDKVLNDSTLLGIDVNNNGVRDDVERWIYITYKDKHPIHIDIAMQASRGYKLILEESSRAKEIHNEVRRARHCEFYYKYDAKYFNEPLLVENDFGTKYLRKKIYFNTEERKNVYIQYDTLLSGDSYTLPKKEDEKMACDFDTSKYEE